MHLRFATQSRSDVVYQFIFEHPGVIKADVIRQMSKDVVASTKVTHEIIQELIEAKKIISVPDPKNRQKHHLYVNDKNHFTTNYSRLSRLEEVIDQVLFVLNKPGFEDSQNLKKTFNHCVPFVISGLLFDTSKAVIDEKDKQSLYSRIIKLMETCSKQFEANYFSNIGLSLVPTRSTSLFIIKNKGDDFQQIGLKNSLELMRDYILNELTGKDSVKVKPT